LFETGYAVDDEDTVPAVPDGDSEATLVVTTVDDSSAPLQNLTALNCRSSILIPQVSSNSITSHNMKT
jgi:hypothetical protein